MQAICRILIAAGLAMLLAQSAVAGPFSNQGAEMVLAARDLGAGKNLIAPRIGSKQATAAVKSKYRGSRILSVNLIASKGPPVYKVKTLSPQGVVKFVYVDGQSGEVFE